VYPLATSRRSVKLSLTSRSTRRVISSSGFTPLTAPRGAAARRMFRRAEYAMWRSCRRSGARKRKPFLPRSRRR
jgi:hypothetical protein